jgi:hypothetical protein
MNNAKGAFGHQRKQALIYSNPDYVYHFTDTNRLPWILERGELLVDRGAIGQTPTKFVWGTTLQNGDRTCAAFTSEALKKMRDGYSRLVRFTFSSQEFEPWTNMREHPDWSKEWYDRLDNSGKRLGGITKQWRVRPTPLPVKNAILIETKSYGGRWETLIKPWWIVKADDNPDLRGIVINGVTYLSVQLHDIMAPGDVGYAVGPPLPASELRDSIEVVEIQKVA